MVPGQEGAGREVPDRSALEQPHLKAFEPLAPDRGQEELSRLEARMEELQAALQQMKHVSIVRPILNHTPLQVTLMKPC